MAAPKPRSKLRRLGLLPGTGGLPFTVGAMVSTATKFPVTSVPFDGDGPGLTALLGGSYAVGSASAGTDLALQAASASGTSLAALGNLDATVSGLADLTDITAGGDLSLTAGTLLATTISADGLIAGNVSGTAMLDSATAGSTLDLTAASLTATSLQSAGDLTLTVTDTATLGTVTSTGGSVFIDPALLTFDAIGAAGGDTLRQVVGIRLHPMVRRDGSVGIRACRQPSPP